MSSFVGIDPGRQGAIAAIGPEGAVVLRVPLLKPVGGKGRPEYDLVAIRAQLLALHRAEPIALAVVEKLDTLPSRVRRADGSELALGGGIANHARGEARGWAWMLTALEIPYELLRPQQWQARMLAKGAGDPKQRSILTAQRLFPRVSLVPPRARNVSDGYADALLLAELARRIHSGGELFAAAERAQTSAREPVDVFEAEPA